MIIEAVFLSSIAVFAVFGLYSCVKLLFCSLFGGVSAAVVLESGDDIEILDLKIKEADKACFCGRCGVLILIPESREKDKNITDHIEKSGYLYLYYKC